MTKVTVAIGDVHGELDKLVQLIKHVETVIPSDHAIKYVFVGDYVDRGPDSCGVIDLVMNMIDGLGAVALRGNHEQMLIDAYMGNYVEDWMHSYGSPTCESFGVDHVSKIQKPYIEWMCKLPYYYQDGLRTFVHAGIDRRIHDMMMQPEGTMIWIREQFLDNPSDTGGFVVHGHTPIFIGRPELKKNRLNLDTGAVFGGELSAAIFNDVDVYPTHFVTHNGRYEKFEKPTLTVQDYLR